MDNIFGYIFFVVSIFIVWFYLIRYIYTSNRDKLPIWIDPYEDYPIGTKYKNTISLIIAIMFTIITISFI